MSWITTRWRAILVVAMGCAACAAVLAIASYIVMPKNNQSAFGMIEPRANGIQGEPDDSIDAVVIGDSEAFSSISPLQMWGEHGFTSYDCSSSGQRLYYTRMLLQRALTRQHPRVVVLETDCFFYTFRISDGLKREIENIFPVFEYHNRWKSLGSQDIAGPLRHTWTDPLKGFRLNANIAPIDAENYMEREEGEARIPLINHLYVDDIARICAENGTRLVLVSAPTAKHMTAARHHLISSIADRIGADYIDLNEPKHRVDIDWLHDTRDQGDHLNIYGAMKTSAALGDMLSKRYHLPDHRGDSQFTSWDEAHARYLRRIERLRRAMG